jgi:hypothetical protein
MQAEKPPWLEPLHCSYAQNKVLLSGTKYLSLFIFAEQVHFSST